VLYITFPLLVACSSDKPDPEADSAAEIAVEPEVSQPGEPVAETGNPTDSGHTQNGSDTASEDTATVDPDDVDGDGSPIGEDCDDSDATILPGAEELCDGKDNDCDGGIDPEDLCGPARVVVLDGYDGTVYASDDSGSTWGIAGTVPFNAPAKVAFAMRADGGYLATTQTGELWLSGDEGAGWVQLPDAPWSSDTDGGPSSHIAMDGFGKYVYATSTSSVRDGILYRTENGGMDWEISGTWPHQTGMDTDIAAVPYGPVYIAHTPYEGGQIYRSDDSGASFALVGSYDTVSGGNAILEVDVAGTVYATGNPETTFFASSDLGTSWTPRGSWISGRSIAAISDHNTTMYAVSVKGNVLRSDDFGHNWDEVGDWGSAAQRDIISASGWIDVLSSN
jgi:photosystem II stability/assembly factor-like uncharacterized protein